MELDHRKQVQPFVNDELAAEQGRFDDLRALYLALQSTLQEARRLGDQIASELRKLGLPDPHDPS